MIAEQADFLDDWFGRIDRCEEVRLRACEVVDVLECQGITQVAQRLYRPSLRAIRMSHALHNSVNEQHAVATGQKRYCIVESTGVSVDEL